MILYGAGRATNLHRNTFVILINQDLLVPRSRADFLHFNSIKEHNNKCYNYYS